MDKKEIEKILREFKEVDVVKVEILGSTVAIFVKDPKPVYETGFVKKVANLLKKRVMVRTHEHYLTDEKEAEKIIREIVPEEANIKNFYFHKPFGEVIIVAEKPGLVIGKGGEKLKEIMVKSKWSPIVEREPSIKSNVLEGIRKLERDFAEERKKFLIAVGKRLSKPISLEWGRVIALGGFREVGRSCLLIQTNKSNVLVDCGVSPSFGSLDKIAPMIDKAGVILNEIDAVVISHAHMDHMGFLPYLFSLGLDAPVYVTPPTKPLMALMQHDYINISPTPIYDKRDIRDEIIRTISVDYNRVVNITDDIKLTFYNAGHILGSAIVHLHIGEGKHNIIYSGDIKYGETFLFNPANTVFPRVDSLFIESTYGAKDTPTFTREDAEKKLIEVIKYTVEKKKGSVLIPAFAVGRSQEVLLAIEHYARNNDWNINIYIDGMISEALAIHMAYPDYLKSSLRKRILSDDNPFEFEYIKHAKGKKREEIVDGEPSVIISPSGMLTGGPSVEYFKLMAEEKRHSIVFVGYQAPLTLGYNVQQGLKRVAVEDEGEPKWIDVNMDVFTVEGFSGHSSKEELLEWLLNLTYKPKRVFTMHGDKQATINMAREIKKRKIDAYAMQNLEALRFL